MDLEWNRQVADFIRGNDLESTTKVTNIDSLQLPLSATWNKAFEIAQAFRSSGPLLILIEVWADTGRVIFRLRDQTEFARIVLNMPIVEEHYFNLPSTDDSEFNRNYRSLVNSVMAQIRTSLPTEPEIDDPIHIILRDSDDNETEIPIS